MREAAARVARSRRRRTVWLLLTMLFLVLGGPTSAPALPGDQLPDLIILPQTDVRIETSGGRRLLRFTTVIANNGVGAFEVRGARASTSEPEMSTSQRIFNSTGGFRDVPTTAKMFWSGDGHNHWHVRDLQTTVLLRISDGVQVGAIAKSGYCFYDNYTYRLSLPGAPQSPVYGSCGGFSALSVRMGLSVGWGDEYPYYLAYQWVDITGLPDGLYRLITIADLANWFSETNELNNSTARDVQISGGGSTPSADVSLSMTDSPDPVTVGSDLTYTMTVRNGGPNSAASVAVSDSVPAGASYVSSSTTQGSCSGTTTVTCSIGTLASGATATVRLVVRPTASGTLSNTARVSSSTGDPATGNNQASASTTVNAALPPPAPSVTVYPDSTTLSVGTPRSGDHTRLAANDNSFYEVNSSANATTWTAHVPGIPNTVRSLRVTYSGAANPLCNQTVAIWNTATGTWTTLDSRWITSGEVLINATAGGTIADYVSGTTGPGDVNIRVQCSSPIAYYSSADLLAIVYDP